MTHQVSVIVPVYNGATFIAEALTSIQAQDYPVSEVIVVDDGSNDGTADVVQSHALTVQYVYQENQGAPAARNKGLTMAQGDVVAFLDADDIWTSDKLTQQVALLGKADVIMGLTRILDDADSQPFILPSLCCALFHRSAFEQIGVFDTELLYSDDLDWYMRAREASLPFVLHRDVVLYHRRHAHNLTRHTTKKKHYQLLMLKKSLARRRKQGIQSVPQFSNFFEDLL